MPFPVTPTAPDPADRLVDLAWQGRKHRRFPIAAVGYIGTAGSREGPAPPRRPRRGAARIERLEQVVIGTLSIASMAASAPLAMGHEDDGWRRVDLVDASMISRPDWSGRPRSRRMTSGDVALTRWSLLPCRPLRPGEPGAGTPAAPAPGSGPGHHPRVAGEPRCPGWSRGDQSVAGHCRGRYTVRPVASAASRPDINSAFLFSRASGKLPEGDRRRERCNPFPTKPDRFAAPCGPGRLPRCQPFAANTICRGLPGRSVFDVAPDLVYLHCAVAGYRGSGCSYRLTNDRFATLVEGRAGWMVRSTCPPRCTHTPIWCGPTQRLS